jgi:hypothetical protein
VVRAFEPAPTRTAVGSYRLAEFVNDGLLARPARGATTVVDDVLTIW